MTPGLAQIFRGNMPFIPIALQVLSSRFTQIGLAFIIGWFWAWIETDNSWKVQIAKEKAAAEAVYKAEIARQKQAAENIAKDATFLAEQVDELVKDLQKQIEEFDQKERVIVKTQKLPCVVDRNFADVVRNLKSSPRR
jgi:predicted transcriptional regulator